MESIKQLVQRVNRSFTESNLSANELDELVEELELYISKLPLAGSTNIQKVSTPRPIEFRLSSSRSLDKHDGLPPLVDEEPESEVNDSVEANIVLDNFTLNADNTNNISNSNNDNSHETGY